MRGTWGNAIKAHKSGVWGTFPGSIFDQWTRFAIPYGAKRAALALATTADADPPTVLAGGGAGHPVALDDVPSGVLCTKKIHQRMFSIGKPRFEMVLGFTSCPWDCSKVNPLGTATPPQHSSQAPGLRLIPPPSRKVSGGAVLWSAGGSRGLFIDDGSTPATRLALTH